MPYVKLDCRMVNSTVWIDRDLRDVFITSLLLAEPRIFNEPVQTYDALTMEPLQWKVPPGWYGLVEAAGPGIIDRAKVDYDSGMRALRRMCDPEAGSKGQDFEGRRLARIDGGYLVLNFQKYRDRDHTVAERQRRYYQRKKELIAAARAAAEAELLHRDVPLVDEKSNDISTVSTKPNGSRSRSIKHKQKESDTTAPPGPSTTTDDQWFDQFKATYPKRTGSQPWGRALKAIHARLANQQTTWRELIAGAARYAAFIRATDKEGTEFVMQAATFCGPDCHFNNDWTPPAKTASTKRDQKIADMAARLPDPPRDLE